MDSFFEGLNQGFAIKDRLRDQKAKTVALRNVLSAYYPDQKDAYASMGLGELEGLVQSHQMQMADQLAQAKLKDYADAATMRQFNMNRQTAGDEATGQFLKNYAGAESAPALMMPNVPMSDIDPGTGGIAPISAFRSALTRTANPGLIDPNQFNAIARFAQQDGSRESTFFTPGQSNFSLPGVKGFLRVPTGPNTSVILSDPASAGTAVPITGPNGEQLGYGLPGRSGVQPMKTGAITARDQYDALQASRRSLVQAKSRRGSSEQAAYDAKIAEIDQQLKQLQAAPEGAPGKAVGLFDQFQQWQQNQ